jgi:hypothetical protein
MGFRVIILGIAAVFIAVVVAFIPVLRLSEREATLRREASTALPATTSWEASAEPTTAPEASAATHHAEQDFWVDATHTAHTSHAAPTKHVGHVDIITVIVTGALPVKHFVSMAFCRPGMAWGPTY